MSTQIEQSVAVREREIATWERDYKPLTLAETPFNRDLFAYFLAERHGGWVSVATLNHCVEALKDKLQWLSGPIDTAPATPTPAPAKGDVWNRLADVGVLKCGQPSWSEQQATAANAEKKRQDRRNEAAILSERITLKKELSAAQCLTVYYANGRTDFGSTLRERDKAVAAVKLTIEPFNRRVSSEQQIKI